MAPWFLIGGAVVGFVALGVLIYMAANQPRIVEPYSTKRRRRRSQEPGPLIDFSEIVTEIVTPRTFRRRSRSPSPRRRRSSKGRTLPLEPVNDMLSSYCSIKDRTPPTPLPGSVETESDRLSPHDISRTSQVSSNNTEVRDRHDTYPGVVSSSQNLCKACDGAINAECRPCGHHHFCREHGEEYLRSAEKHEIQPRCPEPDCRQVIRYFA